MSARVELQGTGEAMDDITDALQDIGKRTVSEIHDFATDVHARAIEGIQGGPAGGRVYEKYNPRRTHRASAQGQYPMSDTGRLASSIYLELLSDRAAVYSDLDYARHLELKDPTRGGRPWLTRAWNEVRARYGW